ncbi:MAG: winged helix-turn-helix transcriptional regulator, partial [Rhodospirillaceae bacterium]|nr:winged helix-turn-helix transcriptional regulator [Rhodospirillaceae bacterium]
SNPVRREILVLLRAGDLNAGEIAEKVAVAKSTLSQHFNVLKAADLVHSTRTGTTITYSLNTSVLEEGLLDVLNLFQRKSAKKEKAAWKKRSALAGG